MTQLSLIGNWANVIQPNFNFQQFGRFDESQVSALQGNDTYGNPESTGFGFNISQEIGESTQLNLSYIFGDDENHHDDKVLRYQFLSPQESASTDKVEHQQRRNRLHKVAVNSKTKL